MDCCLRVVGVALVVCRQELEPLVGVVLQMMLGMGLLAQLELLEQQVSQPLAPLER
jgi:hypothetical protein